VARASSITDRPTRRPERGDGDHDLSTGTSEIGPARADAPPEKASVLETDTLASAMKVRDLYHLAEDVVPEASEAREYWRPRTWKPGQSQGAADAASARRLRLERAVYGDRPRCRRSSPCGRPTSVAVTKMVGSSVRESGHDRHRDGRRPLFNGYVRGKSRPRRTPASWRSSAPPSRDRPLEIYGDGEQTRDFLFVADIGGPRTPGVSPNGATLNRAAAKRPREEVVASSPTSSTTDPGGPQAGAAGDIRQSVGWVEARRHSFHGEDVRPGGLKQTSTTRERPRVLLVHRPSRFQPVLEGSKETVAEEVLDQLGRGFPAAGPVIVSR